MSRKPLGSNDALDPRSYQKIVGATFATHDHLPLITIGNKKWTRWQLGRLGCPHPAAAVRVDRVIRTLKINSPADFVAQAREFVSFKDFGVTSYWVVLALLHDLGYSVEEIHGDNPSFLALHHRALKKDNDAKPSRKRKKG